MLQPLFSCSTDHDGSATETSPDHSGVVASIMVGPEAQPGVGAYLWHNKLCCSNRICVDVRCVRPRHPSSLSIAVTLAVCLQRMLVPCGRAPAGGGPGRHARSRSWSAVEAAFPVGASRLRVEDLEVCLHPSGRLWKLGNGSFGTVRLRLPIMPYSPLPPCLGLCSAPSDMLKMQFCRVWLSRLP